MHARLKNRWMNVDKLTHLVLVARAADAFATRGGDGDVDGRAELAALGDGDVRRVVQKLGLNLGVDASLGVVRGVGLLVEDVIVSRRPLARAETSGEGAVVNHEGDASRVHVRVERVDGFDDGLVAHFRVGVTLLAESVDLGHHARAVHTGGERVERDLAVDALGANLGADLPHVRAVNLTIGNSAKRSPAMMTDRISFVD